MGMFDSIADTASSAYNSVASSATSAYNYTVDAVTNPSKGGWVDTTENLLDPGKARTQISGLFKGGALPSQSTDGRKPAVKVIDPKNPVKTNDWRVKIGLPAGSGLTTDLGNPLLSILSRTNGVVFPYTPNITVTHNARYQEQALTHSNYKNYFYEGSDVSSINIVGDFTVQNKDDALYVLASIYFFRSCTKMFWGKDADAGNPPPIVYLDGYGDYYFPHVSCVVTSFQHTMPADCDYIEVAYAQGSYTADNPPATQNKQYARVPTVSQINVTVQPVYSRQNIANNMSLTAFSQGQLLAGKGGFL
jgi:hypothetical protein